MNAKQSFKSVYALVRTNRRSIHFDKQTFRFANDLGSIYIDGGDLIIGRVGRYITAQPGYNAGGIGSSKHGPHTKRTRAYFLSTSVACADRVPLP